MRAVNEEKHFILDMIKIQLEYAKIEGRLTNISFTKAILDYTMIFNFTDFNKGSLFDGGEPTKQFIEFIRPLDLSTTITEALVMFESVIIDRISKNQLLFESHYDNKSNRAGTSIGTNIDGAVVTMHIHNNQYPNSFLNGSFEKDLVKFLKEIPPHIETLVCTTWLNDVDRFYKCFPASYKASGHYYDHVIRPDLGIFGQFINKKYEINQDVVDYYIKHGTLKYKMKECKVSISELKTMYNIDHV